MRSICSRHSAKLLHGEAVQMRQRGVHTKYIRLWRGDWLQGSQRWVAGTMQISRWVFLSLNIRGQELLRSLYSYWSFPLQTLLLLLLLLQQQMSFVRIRNFKHFQKGSPWMLTKKCWFSWPTALEWNFTRCHFLFSQHVCECECVWAWPKVKENWILYWAWDLGWMNGHSCAASATCTHSLTLICCQSFVVFQFRKCHRTNHLLSSSMFACVCSCVCVCLLLYWFWCFAICLASLLGK